MRSTSACSLVDNPLIDPTLAEAGRRGNRREREGQKLYTSEARLVVSVDTDPTGGMLSYWTL